MLQLAVVTSILFVLETSACGVKTTLKETDPSTLKGIYCSPQLTRVQASNSKEDKFIGFYRKTQFKNHICYYDKVKDDLVKLSSLSGGKMYTTGE